MHDQRVSGRLGPLAEFLLPEQQPQVIDLIRAVDRLTRANEVLQAAVLRHIGAGSASVFDRSQVANMIGVFSRDVAILDERMEGDGAVVTIQVADRVPLEEVHLVRRGGPLSPHCGWLLRTDPPIDGLAKELRNLAEVLIETARRLAKEPMTAAQLRGELELRQAAIWRRLTALIDGASKIGQKPPPDDP